MPFVRYIKLRLPNNSRLYGRWYKIVSGSGRPKFNRKFNTLASLDAEN